MLDPLILLLDGECHNGGRPLRLAPWHWQFEARGDNGHYCYYFHFGLLADEAGEAVVDVMPDGDLFPESARSFRSHRPEAIWLRRGQNWERHRIEPDCPGDGLRIRVEMAAGERVSVSRMWPFSYSDALRRLEELAEHPEASLISIGESGDGRSIPALEVGSGTERVLGLAGQHPAEFGGTQAVMGLAEWLLSRLPGARAARERYRVTLVPVLNPDGNAGGHCGANPRGEDLYRAFAGAAGGAQPDAVEAACLWRWIDDHTPRLTLNFHCFTQPSPAGSFPWEGMYTAPDEAFATPAARERQRHLDDWLAWETAGLSQSGRFADHVPGSLEYQLAALGVLNVFYEVQDAMGPLSHRRTGPRVFRTALQAIAHLP
jgi:hypothetical protein